MKSPGPQKTTDTDHKKRINNVFTYIDANLDADLSLDTLAEIANFSPFHFHRIFKTITGETVNEYVTRRRIERAASLLIHRKSLSITELSLQNGFDSNSSFTRTFRKFYGMSPTAFRKQNSKSLGRISQRISKIGQDPPDHEKYICIINDLNQWITMNAKIDIREMPALNLAYVSSIGPQSLPVAYQKLITWASPKGLFNDKSKFVTIYHDSFKITEYQKVRLSACLMLDKPEPVEDEIGFTSIEAGKCVVGRFEIPSSDFTKSWTALFLWLNENGYKKSERNVFEIYHNNFQEHPEQKSIVDFCIPIE